MPQICGQQTHRRNALPGDQADQSPEQLVVTIPMSDDVITSLQQRFSAGQDVIMKGKALLPLYVITNPDWSTTLQPFLEFIQMKSLLVMLWILNSNCGMRCGNTNRSSIGNQFKNSMFEQLEITSTCQMLRSTS